MTSPYSFRHKHDKPLHSIEGPWLIQGPGVDVTMSNRTDAALMVRWLNIAYGEGRIAMHRERTSVGFVVERIRAEVQGSGCSLKDAARKVKAAFPGCCLEVMDMIGSWPSSEPAGFLGSTASLLRRTKRELAEQIAFDRTVARHIRVTYDALPPEESYGVFVLKTRAGLLSVGPRGTWIHLRFRDPERAVQLIPHLGEQLNRYSGKWNIHLSDDVAENLAELDRRLRLCGASPRSRLSDDCRPTTDDPLLPDHHLLQAPTVRIRHDEEHGVLTEAPSDGAGDALASLEEPLAALVNGRGDDLHH